ncbi:very short patch repair endonuclease [Mycolicibacter algericus]|uniref:very short patch repair endonuclease n=1 Tax=Mycolicibacter algericus TaxID=1288388 RepID=UPI003C77E2C2
MTEVGARRKDVLTTTDEVRRRMSAQRTRDTGIEIRLRSLLHAQGLRYRVHQRPLAELRRVADLVFRRGRVAVFVDGCFWHGCSEHGTWPKQNAQFWRDKIQGNVRRDRDTDAALTEAGWLPVRVWEHEDAHEAAKRIAGIVRARSAR